ncbi:hypothetical protein N5K37_07380 [Delftia tsuruhatensis]|uniref:rolling circle replication-associated protein n=1 Tax=Delftia tsuruhatensis TaxID=180282 RepID=UPI00244A39AB|nr:hypothetical protein [Delftia tsuruhatensis]MDH2229719.1 hypothetical protein [Delftia tsuruhatensis]
MIRIICDANPTRRYTPQELLHMHRRGEALTVFDGSTGEGMRVKAHDLGNGHMEITGTAPTVWVEREWNHIALETYLERVIERREEEAEEMRERSLTIAANRAKVKVRKLCKAMGSDTLLTLTYRANETDLERSKKDLKEFVRRMRRYMPEFKAVAVYEYQARGAIHWHIATANVPRVFERKNDQGQTYQVKSFDAIRSVWRGVTKERGGNIDLARRKRNSMRSPARIASYIAKYIVKAFREGQAFTNRYSAFGDFEMGKPVDLGWFPRVLDAVSASFDCVLDSQSVVYSELSRWKDWFVLHVERKTTSIRGCIQ